MSATVTLPAEEVEELRQRVARLARDNAGLRVINGMLTRLSAVGGLSNVVDDILAILMEAIGGSNLIVYFTMDGRWHARDVYGTVRDMESPDDPLVARALQGGVVVRSGLSDQASPADSPPQQTLVFPLAVQHRIVGAVVMEGMQLSDDSISRDLQPFFVYAALKLDLQISNYSALDAAHRQLLAAHEGLEREVSARREAEEHYRILFEQSPDGVLLVDPATKQFVQFNAAAHQHLGYTSEEFAALRIPDVDAIDSPEQIGQRTQQFLSEKALTFESVHRAKDGSLRDVLVTGKLLPIAGRPLVLVIFRDITDQKRIEAERLRSQKLESIAVLAGGIAHDFNNLLMGILGNISLASMALRPADPAAAPLEDAEKACLRARDLTHQLLTFARGGAPVKKLAAVGPVVQESATFAARGSEVRCDVQIPADLWYAEIDEGQISQVVHNLVLNAVQAMPAGGDVHIRCRNIPAATGGADTGECVGIDVEDHGIGIQPEHLARIFDPYFTTKQQGSGLGLASVYSIIRGHDGRVEVESAPGKGTTFHLYLPAAPGGALVGVGVDAVAQTRRGRILVMDDEEMVRAVVARVLTQLGHEAETAPDGASAISAYRRALAAGRPFDLVILDLTVPGAMGGREALARLRDVDPAVKAIVSSGYANDSTVSDFASFGFSGVLSKPYNVNDLKKILAELLS